MMGERWDRRDVLARTDLAAVLTDLGGEPVRLGRLARWHCPDADHPDSDPSVTMFTDRNGIERWRCWSGGHGGTAIDAVIAAHHLDIGTALAELATRAGLTAGEPLPPVVPRPPVRPAATVLDPGVVAYVEACEQILWTRTARPVLDWLHERGIGDAVLHANRVGADPGPGLLRRPPTGFPAGGLAAVFPALAIDGCTITYCQTRYLAPPPGRGRYDNPSAARGPNPRVGWVTVDRVHYVEALLVCEGLPDAYSAAEAGFSAVAVLGAGYPDAHVADQIAAARGERTVVVVYDADDAGRVGARTLTGLLHARQVPVIDVCPPETVGDLNAWAQTTTTWPATITNAITRTAVTAPHARKPVAAAPVGRGPVPLVEVPSLAGPTW